MANERHTESLEILLAWVSEQVEGESDERGDEAGEETDPNIGTHGASEGVSF